MTRPFKLGVSGTHSTGNSTFLDNLAEALKSCGAKVWNGAVTDIHWLAVTVLDPEIPLGPKRPPDLVFRQLVAKHLDAWAKRVRTCIGCEATTRMRCSKASLQPITLTSCYRRRSVYWVV
jgi:hypothetical protein